MLHGRASSRPWARPRLPALIAVRGRPSLRAGLGAAPRVLVAFFALLGPGLIAANAGNDAGGIATYSAVGAKYGYDLLWMMVRDHVLA